MIANQSPYWLRLNNTWVHLDGVEPGVDIVINRASSDFTSVDGVRWSQKAPKGPRDWALTYRYAIADAVSALKVAVDIPSNVLFLDTTMAQINMLAPADCYGVDQTAGIVDCGGVPLRELDLSSGKAVTIPVRGGVTYYARLWGGPDGATVGSVAFPGGSQDLVSTVSWPDIWPEDWPTDTGLVAPFTPTADGDATLTLAAGTTGASGLMVAQDVPPHHFMAGMSMPCQVSVEELSQTANFAWADRYGWSDYTVSVREVG